jgi:hypothetical protein
MEHSWKQTLCVPRENNVPPSIVKDKQKQDHALILGFGQPGRWVRTGAL